MWVKVPIEDLNDDVTQSQLKRNKTLVQRILCQGGKQDELVLDQITENVLECREMDAFENHVFDKIEQRLKAKRNWRQLLTLLAMTRAFSQKEVDDLRNRRHDKNDEEPE